MPQSKNNLQHLAIIMDGNSRWAKANGKTKLQGHKKGAEAARAILKPVIELGIKYLTLYTFSSENWGRPQAEVKNLMNLLKYYLGNELDNLHKNNIRLRIIGDTDLLSKDIQKRISAAENLTKNNDSLTLILALSYGSRQEILHAAKQLFIDAVETTNLTASALTKKINSLELEDISSKLYTSDIPNPDLLIRTGGDHRISNFLLWQMAYTEFYFTETLWPAFDESALESAVYDYRSRERRFGKR